MALPGYNSKVGHETPSLLDTVLKAVGGAWETGSDWLEEKGTAVKEAGVEFLESYPETDNPYKEGRNWSEWTDEEISDFYAKGDKATDTVFNFMGGGLGTIGKAGAFIKPLPKIGDLGKQAVKAEKLTPLAKAKESFAFGKGIDIVDILKDQHSPDAIRNIWNRVRHSMSNYEEVIKKLNPEEHHAFISGLYTDVMRGLRAKGYDKQADILKGQLLDRIKPKTKNTQTTKWRSSNGAGGKKPKHTFGGNKNKHIKFNRNKQDY